MQNFEKLRLPPSKIKPPNSPLFSWKVRKINDDKSAVIHAKTTLHLWVILDNYEIQGKIVKNYQASKTFVFISYYWVYFFCANSK